jgi:tetratricopeptide (TPR) repeat protein
MRVIHLKKTSQPSGIAGFCCVILLSMLWTGPAQATLQRCQDFSERGLHDVAIKLCTSVLHDLTSPAEAKALFYRANSYYSLGDRDSAQVDLDAAINAGYTHPAVYALLGSIKLAEGDDEQADRALTLAINQGFDATQVLRHRANARLALGHSEDAISDLNIIVDRVPRDPISLTQLALALYLDSRFDEARDIVDRAIDANNSYAPAFGVRAAIAVAKGTIGEALVDYSAAISKAPRKAAYLVGRADTLFQGGNIQLAKRSIEDALRIEPGSVSARSLLSNILEASGELSAALEELDGLSLDDTPSILRRARLALQLGHFGRAEADYSMAIANDPGNGIILFERGQTRLLLKQPAEANDDLSMAIKSDPTLADSGLHLKRGQARFAIGNLSGAAEDFAAEIKSRPQSPRPRIWYVRTLSDLEDFSLAEIQARKLLKIEPGTSRVHAILGDVLLLKGDIAGGRKSHQRALSINANYAPSKQRLDEISSAMQ